MDKHRVAIIGGGIAGLTACLELAHHGYDVTLIEKMPTVGGKIRQVDVHGAGIDSGPTVFTMRWVFDELFQACDCNFEKEVAIQELSVLAKHYWQKDSLNLYADISKSALAIRDFSGIKQERLFLEFCEVSKKVYNALEKPYIKGKRPSFTSMITKLGLSGTKSLLHIGPFSALWQSLEQFFPDPRLQQLFGRYSTYCGSSPYLAPATLMLIAHVEMLGVWSVKEGMIAIPQTIARLAKNRGAKIITNQTVLRIQTHQNCVQGVELQSGELIPADSIIFNGDVAALSTGLLGEQTRLATPVSSTGRSLSAMTWSMQISKNAFELSRHNVFFDQNYDQEFTDIFQRNRLPTHPTVYICAQDRLHSNPDKPLTEPLTELSTQQLTERLLILVNAPANGDQPPNDKEIAQCEQQVFSLLAQSGLEIYPTTANTIRTTPQMFHQLFPATGGALYGMATHGWMSSFARPSSKSRIQNLYLAGGSVHPGPGVPMAALSGRLAAATLMERHALTK